MLYITLSKLWWEKRHGQPLIITLLLVYIIYLQKTGNLGLKTFSVSRARASYSCIAMSSGSKFFPKSGHGMDMHTSIYVLCVRDFMTFIIADIAKEDWTSYYIRSFIKNIRFRVGIQKFPQRFQERNKFRTALTSDVQNVLRYIFVARHDPLAV